MTTTAVKSEDDQPIPLEMQRRIQQWMRQNNDKARGYANAIIKEWKS